MLIGASYLNLGSKCPGSWQLRRNNKRKTEAATDGIAMHQMIEDWINGDKTENISDDLILEFERFKDWYLLNNYSVLREGECERQIKDKDYGLISYIDWCGDVDGMPTIIDWKHGKGQRWYLPPIDEDLQLLAYGLLWANLMWEKQFVIKRVMISEGYVEEHYVDCEEFEELDMKIRSLTKSIQDNKDVFCVGPHCDNCYASQHCSEWLKKSEEIRSLVAFGDGELTSDQALKWALYRGSVKDLTKQMDAALRDYLENGGELLYDNKKLKQTSGKRSKISDCSKAVNIVKGYIGEKARGIETVSVKVTKSSIERVLLDEGYKRKEILSVFERLESEGILEKYEITKGLRWVNV